MSTLVVGLGNPDRRDDGVGVRVAERVGRRRLPGVEVRVVAVPADLIDMWSGRDLVVVADATRTGAPPGTVSVVDAAEGGLHRRPPVGTHDVGLGDVVELARALGRLPERLLVVGVEAGDCSRGVGLSPEVGGAVPGALAAVLGVLPAAQGPASST